MISGDRGGQGVGQSLPIHLFEMLHPKTDEYLNPSVEVHHLFGKLSTVETLLTEVQRKVPCPRSFLVINVCNQEKTLRSPCIYAILIAFALQQWLQECVSILRSTYSDPLVTAMFSS